MFRQIAAMIKSTIPKEKQAGASSVLPAFCNSGFSFHFHKKSAFWNRKKCRDQSGEFPATGSARTGGRAYLFRISTSYFL
ncbi:hypothetical protein L3K78_09760, partial [Oscillospiraceae bacterium SCCA1]|nr:hypothetical protein [Oscillospiraceae bacterium SCCA1]